MKNFTNREFMKLLHKNGFTLARTSGGHMIYERGSESLAINNKPNACICRRLIKEFGLK